jgi:hypothetical protein
MIRTHIDLKLGDGNFNIPVDQLVVVFFPGTKYYKQEHYARNSTLDAELVITQFNEGLLPGLIETILKQTGLLATELEMDYMIAIHPENSKPVLIITMNLPEIKRL